MKGISYTLSIALFFGLAYYGLSLMIEPTCKEYGWNCNILYLCLPCAAGISLTLGSMVMLQGLDAMRDTFGWLAKH